MSPNTYKTRAIVLRKTKLREKDLIVTMLDEDGRLVQGVAKGARKPGGSLSARLELFSLVDVLMARGRSLDVVCEARLVGAPFRETGMEQAVCAAPLAELLCHVAQPDLPQPRLHDLARVAIAHIMQSQPGSSALALGASLWKTMAVSGFRPSFRTCALCGSAVDDAPAAGTVALSLSDGGIVCDSCRRPADAIAVEANVVRWCEALIASRFDEIDSFECDIDTVFSVLHLSRAWIRTHTGKDLKSLDFLFTSGIF